METIKIWNDRPSADQLDELVAYLKNGCIGIIPTDSMYAIVGDALNVKAVEKICKIKGINPLKTNLSIICSDISMASEYCRIDNNGFRILKQNTPGAFTFLFSTVSSLPRAFRGRKVVGVRIPDCNLDRLLAERMASPLITTSILYEDEDAARNPDLIAEAYDRSVDFMAIGDDGTTDVTTIVDCTQNPLEIEREGIGVLQ